MSKLEFYSRPLVAFDPSNKQHRRWYYDFLKYQGWGRCPVRFICPDESGMDLTIMIRNMLVEYYVEKEFKGVAQKPHQDKPKKMVVQNRKKRLTDEQLGVTLRHTGK